MNYAIVEEQHFTNQAASIGDTRRVDEALQSVIWALANSPDIFPVVPPTKNIRLAKTNTYKWIGGVIPRLRVWFTIDGQTVRLLAIKIDPDPNP